METHSNKPEQDSPSDKLPEAIALLCQHLVGLTWYQGLQNSEGMFIAKPEWQAASAFVVELNERIWLATAGHVFADVDKAKEKNPNFKTGTARVWDGWNLDAAYSHPIPYDFFDSDVQRLSINETEKGIDLTLIPVTNYLGNLLSQTTLPFPRVHWFGSHTQEYTTYYIVGTPTCLAEETNTSTKDGNTIENSFRPFIVAVQPIDPSEVDATEYDQFVARIHPSFKIESVKGMSGGVILGFKQDDNGDVRYRPVAVQSRWLPRRRIIMGTYLSPCLEGFEKILQNPEAYDLK